jgi:hypothetical protein
MEKFILNNTSLKFKENGKLDLPKNKKHSQKNVLIFFSIKGKIRNNSTMLYKPHTRNTASVKLCC